MGRALLLRAIALLLCLVLGCAAEPQESPAAANWQIKKVAIAVGRPIPLQLLAPESDIYVIDFPGSKPRKLVEGSDPAWSPDGERIAYCPPGVTAGVTGGLGQIHVISADGSVDRQLTNLKGRTCDPDWSPDGSKIAATNYQGRGTTHSVVVMDKDGKNISVASEGYGARWSPDGKKLVFSRGPDRHGGPSSIWIANADGTEAKRVIEDNSPVLQVTWFPDGRSFVFASVREHRSAIFRVNLDGTGLEKIASDKELALFSPVLSPDGTQLVVNAAADHGRSISILSFDLTNHTEKQLGRGRHGSVLWVKK